MQQLREREEMFSMYFDNANIGVCMVSFEGKFLAVNKILSDWLGYSKEELLQLTFNDITHEEDKEIGNDNLQQLIKGEIEKAEIEKRYITKDNKCLWAIVSVGIVSNPGIGRKYMVTYVQNITDRKLIQNDLEKSVSLLKSSLESTADGLLIVDNFGKAVEFNQRFVDMWKIPESIISTRDDEKMISYIFDQLTEPDVFLKKVKELYQNPSVKSFDIIYFKDGRIFERYSQPQLINNDIVGRVWSFHDITDRKKAENNLVKSEEKFKNAFRFAAFGMALINMKGQFIEVNPSFCSIMGYTEKELAEKTFSDLTYPDDIKAGLELSKELYEGLRDYFWLEKRYVNKSGNIIWVLLSVTAIRDSNGKTIFTVAQLQNITEKHKLETDLKQSEMLYRSVFDKSADAFAILDKSGKLLSESSNIEKFSGYSRAERQGKNGLDLIHPDDMNTISKAFKSISELPNKTFNTYFRSVRKDGTIWWTEASATNLLEDPAVNGIVVNYRDITSRVLAEDSLQEERALLRTIVDNLPIALYIKDKEGKKLLCNPVDLINIGKPEQEVIGKTDFELFPGEIAEQTTADELLVMKTGNPIINKEEYIVNYEGKSKWLLTTKVPRKNNLGEIIGIIGLGLEITDRKKSENEIKLNNERLESLVRISQYSANDTKELIDFALEEAIRLTQSKIGLIFVHDENSKKYLLFSWSKNILPEYITDKPEKILSLEKMDLANEVILTRKPVIINDYNKVTATKNGMPEGHIELKNYLSIPVIINNNIIALVGVANKNEDYVKTDERQLTLLMDSVWKNVERIKIMEELVKAKEKAEESDRLKTSFLCNISHEIRTPMNAIIGFTGFLLNPNLPLQRKEFYTSLVKERSYDLLRIIDDVLDISKIEVGQMKLFEAEINLLELMRQLYEFYNFKKEKEEKLRNITLNFSLEEKLKRTKIKVDDQRLKQIMNNLLDNAFKFIKSGSIEYGCKTNSPTELLFFVKDTGIGIPADKHELIFDRFRQAEDSMLARQYGGMGLGLSIAKGLLNLMNGRIWLESEENNGTTFYFTIPFIPAAEVGTMFNPGPEKDFKRLKNKTILVVEDYEPNLIYIDEVLNEANVNYINAINGNEALDIFNNNPNIDLVLMDIRLPGMNGFDLTKEIKKIKPKTIIIAQTAYATPEDVKLCKDQDVTIIYQSLPAWKK